MLPRGLPPPPPLTHSPIPGTEMRLNGEDVWLHAAPLFHLVDVFAVYAISLVGGRHVLLPTFTAQDALLAMGEGGGGRGGCGKTPANLLAV